MEIHHVLRPIACLFVLNEIINRNERDSSITEISSDTVPPSVLELDSIDPGNEINSVWNLPKLDDESRRHQVFERTESELLKNVKNLPCIRLGGANEKINIPGESGNRMICDGPSSDEEVFNALLVQ